MKRWIAVITVVVVALAASALVWLVFLAPVPTTY